MQDTKRLCVNYGRLNAHQPTVLGNKSSGVITLVDIPKIDERLACFCDSGFFISLHMRSGYHHIKLSPEMRHNRAFTTIFSKYTFLRIPFGLALGPAYFTELIQKVLGQFNEFCFFHMDIVLVHDSSKKNHLKHLRMIHQKIREAGLRLKLSNIYSSKDIYNI